METALAQVGPRLRQARQDKGWTLEELAAGAGLSASTLSRLESGKRQATLELLLPLTRLLGIRIDDLLPSEVPDPRVRQEAIQMGGVTVVPLASESSPVRTYLTTFPPVDEPPELTSHGGYEWLFVLDGALRLRVGPRDLTLGPGEAAEFDTRHPHSLSAAGEAPARVLSIFTEGTIEAHTGPRRRR
ncbi:MAG: helix-turn-helix transcriptional regulator [Propionibacterium sp.]|nr:helix-turn-helix transcriptional regulator [Propionibacterium sp.]